MRDTCLRSNRGNGVAEKRKLTKCTISWWPWAAAKCRGVSSPRLVELMRAPLCTSISTIFKCPSLAAQCSGLNPWSSLEHVHTCDEKIIWRAAMRQKKNRRKTTILSYPWFMSCSVSSSHTRTCIAFPSRHHWNTSSILSRPKMRNRNNGRPSNAYSRSAVKRPRSRRMLLEILREAARRSHSQTHQIWQYQNKQSYLRTAVFFCFDEREFRCRW